MEDYPFGLLTMIVSLEAIFLSTFVMISQNRADARRQVIADEQWKTVKEEDKQNKELLDLSKQILQLTKEVRSRGSGWLRRRVTRLALDLGGGRIASLEPEKLEDPPGQVEDQQQQHDDDQNRHYGTSVSPPFRTRGSPGRTPPS